MTEYSYIKLNTKPIKIEFARKKKRILNGGRAAWRESGKAKPSFVFNGTRYFSEDFISTHNNPHIDDRYPAFIHGYQSGNRYDPMFIEVIGTHSVNLYKEVPGIIRSIG